jgi:sulfate transport system ATP-binding protein
VEELLELVQLPGLGRRYPRQLSGGQRQRVALARALAIEPKLLLLDEPFGALDAKVRKELRVWLRELHDRTGLTSLFVTHDQEEALELADQVVVLRDGRIEQQGNPAALVDAPATAFVSSFLGDVNRLPCTVVEPNVVEVTGLRLPGDTRGLAIGSRAIADIRPRAIRLLPGGTTGDGLVPGTARRVLHSATTVTVEAETPLSPNPIRIEADRYSPDLPALSIGDSVTLRLPPPFVFAAER